MTERPVHDTVRVIGPGRGRHGDGPGMLVPARSASRANELRRLENELRQVVVDDLADETRRRDGEGLGPMAPMDRRRRAEATIQRGLRDRYRTAVAVQNQLSVEEESEVQANVVAQVFSRLPALEALLTRSDVTDIFHNGPNDARIRLVDGSEQRIDPFFSSDQHMITTVRAIARRGGQLVTGDDLAVGLESSGGALEQEFSETRPAVDLRLLPSGARFTALGPWVTLNGTHISIRLHPLVDADQARLVDHWGMYDAGLASFLAAAMRLGWRLFIAGAPGAGKTTLMRALAHEMPRGTRIVQIEQNPELGLQLDPAHDQVLAWVERPANMEGKGALTLADLTYQAQRHSPDRVIIGEVRGGEVMALLEALSLGVPGMCTMHATSAQNVLSRLVLYAQRSDSNLAAEHVLRSAAEGLDVIVHLARAWDGRRVIREVLHVGEFDEVARRPITDQWFIPDDDGYAVRNPHAPIPVGDLEALREFGYDESLHGRGGSW